MTNAIGDNKHGHFVKFGLIAAATLLLAACTSQFKSDVSSWHQLQMPNGESFNIVAKDPNKQGSIEFAHYAELVSLELQRLGYKAARKGESAQLIVRMDYGVNDGRADVRSYGGSYFGYGGYGHGGYWGHHGFGYPGMYNNDVRTRVVYSRHLDVEITPSTASATNLYESKVVSDGRNNRLQEVIPLLIQAMFQDFPGESGVTRRVDIELDKPESKAY